MKNRLLSALSVVLLATSTVAVSIDAASARGFSRSVTATGANGHGFTKNVNRSCADDSCTGTRSLQTNGGYGYTATHNRSCADGTCNGSTTVTGDNGNTWNRSGTATANGNGTGDWYSTTTGPNGGDVSRSGSWSH